MNVVTEREVGTFVAGRNPVGMAVSSDGQTGFVAAFDEDAVLMEALPEWVGGQTALSSRTPLVTS